MEQFPKLLSQTLYPPSETYLRLKKTHLLPFSSLISGNTFIGMFERDLFREYLKLKYLEAKESLLVII